jgi:toxin FitB
MSYLIDTDILSLLEKKNPPAKLAAFIARHDGEIFVSTVSWAELEFGLEAAPATHRPALKIWLEGVRGRFSEATEPLDEAVLVRWKQLLADLKAKNRTIACEDSLIAATALLRGHTVLTGNKRHFEPTGARVEDPTH